MANKTKKEIPLFSGGSASGEKEVIESPSTKRPEMVEAYIGLITDYNYNYDEIDVQMVRKFPGRWNAGDAKRYWQRYPALRDEVRAARAIALRQAGADKVKSIKCYVDAQDAERVMGDGSICADHKTRIEASDRILKLMGEDTTGRSNINLNLGDGDHKIMIVSSTGKKLGDAV